MASKDPNIFELELTRRIGRVAYGVALPAVRRASRQLAAAMTIEVDGPGRVRLHIPHYWAKYLNEGRGEAFPQRASVLVWFRNPADDPRYPGGIYPVFEPPRQLTADEFYEWIQKNQEALDAGQLPPMVVALSSGATTGKRFFSNSGGMAPLRAFLDADVPGRFNAHVKAFLGASFKAKVSRIVQL